MTLDSEFVKKSFLVDAVIERYAEVTRELGLWISERTLFQQYVKKDSRILDIGCGTGRTTFGLHRLGYYKIVAVDFSEKMIDAARSIAEATREDIQFEVGDATQLQYPGQSFDVVLFSHNGLMTIPTNEARLVALYEIHRMLRQDGVFIFTTHDRGFGSTWKPFWSEEEERWQKGKQDAGLNELGDRIIEFEGHPTFVHFPMRDEVLDALKRAGFELIEDIMRSEYCEEPDNIQAFTSDCRLWVARRGNAPT